MEGQQREGMQGVARMEWAAQGVEAEGRALAATVRGLQRQLAHRQQQQKQLHRRMEGVVGQMEKAVGEEEERGKGSVEDTPEMQGGRVTSRADGEAGGCNLSASCSLAGRGSLSRLGMW